MYRVDMLDKKDAAHPRRDGAGPGMRFHYATQNRARFKTYELLITEIFYLITSDHR